MRRRALALLLTLSACGIPAAVSARPAPIRLARAPGRPLPAVVADRDGLAVAHARGSAPLALPPGARVEAVAGLATGWLVAATRPAEQGRELLLVVDDGAGAGEVPPPPARSAERSRPVPVVSEGALAGLLWLEGTSDSSCAVLWSAWSGTGFEPPAVVAPPGPGSQLALAAAPLADGRILAVWAGFDGTDDEIWASVRSGAGWSAPERVAEDDRVPDITPAVAPLPGGGAWIAWSGFDGSEYRLETARFDGESFRASAAPGPAGSLYPSFEQVGAESLLLWFDAAADAWTVGALTADGRIEARASTPGASGRRPAIERSGERLSFLFDREGSGSGAD